MWKACKNIKLWNIFWFYGVVFSFFFTPAVFWSWSSSTTSPALCPEFHSHACTCEYQSKIVKVSAIVLLSPFKKGDSKRRGAGMKKSSISELINKENRNTAEKLMFFFTWGFVTEDISILILELFGESKKKKTNVTRYFKTWDTKKTANEKCILRENSEPCSALWNDGYKCLCLCLWILKSWIHYLQP